MNISLGRPKVRLRIDFASGRALGPGKVDLLEAVARTGSLTAAATACEMSYKRAWMLLRSAGDVFGATLVDMVKGGRGGGGGATVTPLGRAVIEAYRLAEQNADTAVSRAFAGFSVSSGRRAKRSGVKRLSHLPRKRTTQSKSKRRRSARAS